MKINTNNETENLTVTLEIDTKPLEDKLKLLSEFKACLLKYMVDNVALESSLLIFNKGINYSNILFSEDEITIRTTESNKLFCVLDFNIINFFREWFIAMRTANINISFHDNSLSCRGD